MLTLDFSGPGIVVVHGDARKGGKAVVLVDGEKQGPLSFHGDSSAIDFGQKLAFRNLGAGAHTIGSSWSAGPGYVDGVRHPGLRSLRPGAGPGRVRPRPRP